MAILILLSLCSCAEYTAASIEKKRQYSDTEAMVFQNAPCAMTVGAYWRTLSSAQRNAVNVLCGGDPTNDELSAEEVRKITDFFELLDRSKAAVGN